MLSPEHAACRRLTQARTACQRSAAERAEMQQLRGELFNEIPAAFPTNKLDAYQRTLYPWLLEEFRESLREEVADASPQWIMQRKACMR
jgi:hypothetical protein